jgi:hypothetical protein
MMDGPHGQYSSATGNLPSNWSKKRKEVLERDGYCCQNCNVLGGPYGNARLEVHHIVPRRNGGSHRIGNLQTLCKGCHDAITYDKAAPTARAAKNQSVNRENGRKTNNPDAGLILVGAVASATVLGILGLFVKELLGINLLQGVLTSYLSIVIIFFFIDRLWSSL